jgi:nitrogen regulatory protein PII
MKEIRAYIQPRKLDNVVRALHKVEGLTGLSITDVRGFGRGHKRYREFHAFIPHVKIEIACRDDMVERLVEVIRQRAHTGLRGDGKIYVVEIATAVRISTGETGESAV